MTVENQSGKDIEYDVEPSDPGGPGSGNVSRPVMYSLIASGTGATFMGIGCLTGFGDQSLVLAGLGFLAVGLVFQGVAFDRARRLEIAGPTLRIRGGAGRRRLDDGEVHRHTFVAGTWVEFWDPDNPGTRLAQSPPIFKPTARVILRRCLGGSSLVDCTTDKKELLRTQGDYHVEVV